MTSTVIKAPGKGEKHGICATPACGVRGAFSPSKSSDMTKYYCESCGMAINSRCLSNGQSPDIVVRANSFGD